MEIIEANIGSCYQFVVPVSSRPRSLTSEELAEFDDFILTLDEVAIFTKLSKTTIYRLCKAGDIPHSKMGGSLRFVRSKIESWLKGEIYE